MEAYRLLEEGIIVGIDEENKVILILKSVYDRIPKTLIPSGYKIITLRDIPRALIKNQEYRKKKYDRLVSGISTGHAMITAGTLGWFVIDKKTGETVQLSNAHVFHPRPTSKEPPTTRDILQPGPFDGGDLDDVSGYYIRHVPIKPLMESSKCPVAKVWSGIYNKLAELFGANTRIIPIVKNVNRVDAAIANIIRPYEKAVLIDENTLIKPRVILGLLFAGSRIDNIMIFSKAYNIEEELEIEFEEELKKPVVGEKVRYCGRTSGCQEGKIVATNVTVNVMYGISMARFTDVVLVNGVTNGGDSGSLVWK